MIETLDPVAIASMPVNVLALYVVWRNTRTIERLDQWLRAQTRRAE